MSGGAPVRAAAAQAVADVAFRGRSLDQALPARLAGLSGADRALAANLAYGAIRGFPRLDRFVGLLLERPLPPREADVRALLVVGLLQFEDTRIPDHAAVAETVDAARRLGRPKLAGLVNGCLRRWQREGQRLAAGVSRQPEVVHAHPRWWLDALSSDWPGDWEHIVAEANARAPMWLRINKLRTQRNAYRSLLTDEAGLDSAPWEPAPEALRLAEPTDVDRLPGFRDGLVSVQDGAAQLAAGLVGAAAGHRVLDACAAPGGKACHLLERVPGIDLTALDADGSRLERVGENLRRLGLEAKTLAGDARQPDAWWDGRPYDRILVDAPCTGSGVVRRHPDIKLLRRPGDVAAMAAVQSEILEALWRLLTPGGRLVYATCSVFRAENSRQVAAFLARTRDATALEIPESGWGRVSGPGRQILPGEAGVDGFYYACLQRRA